jgi:hypothetical protein
MREDEGRKEILVLVLLHNQFLNGFQVFKDVGALEVDIDVSKHVL